MMSDDSDENVQFIIQNSKKSWGYTSAAKKLRSAGPVRETKGRGKQEDAYAVQKDMEIQEAHRLLTEAGVGDQEMDENEREQLLVALRNSLKNTQAAQKNKDEDEVATSDSEIPHEKVASSTSRLRHDQRGKTEATSKVRVENLPKRERKRKYRRNMETEEEVEVSSSSDNGDWKGSSEASNSKLYRSPLQITDEHRQRAIHMLSKKISQQLAPIKEKSECEVTSEALFMTGKENLSGKTVSWNKEKKHETATASADQVDLTDIGDSVVDTTERVAGAESDQIGLPHLHQIKVPVSDEEQSNQEMPYILARPCEPQHKTEELTQKGATLSLYQEEEESSDADKKPLPHDDIFCWCNTKSCKQLKRRYRRKQLSWEKNTYFCPSPLINPSDYSKVILKLFNLYFAQYTNYQKTFFQNMLSWGSSVTVGHHCSGTLTAKKRGDPSQGFELESDDKHAFSASPTSGSDPRKNVQAEHRALNKKIQLEKKDGTGKFSQRVHALCSTHTLETEDTQPYDSGDELPDITFPMTQRLVEKDNQGMESQQGSKDQIEVQTVKNEKSSVSSESLGFIFCEDSEECPHLSSSSDSKLTLLRKQQQNSSHKNRRDPENLQISRQFSPAEALEQKEIRRKRKHNNPTEDNVCSVNDDDFEISFLLQKKHSGNKKRQGEVYATGQKRPASTKCTEDNSSQLKKMALSEGSSSLSGSHSQDSLESALGRRAESDKVMEPASSDKEGKRGYFEGPEKQAENDVYISKIAYRDPSSTRQRRNLTQKGYRQNEEVAKTEQVIPDAEGPNTKQSEVEGKEQSEVQCPMCFKSFPKDVVEEHAYICQGSESLGDISNDRPHQRVFPQRSKTTDLLLMPLTRQPIHDSDYRVPTTCTICEAQVLGQRAYQQHYRRCLKRTLPTQQHLVKGGQLGREQNEFDVPMSRHVALRDNPETSKDMSQDMAEDSDSDLHSDDATNDPDFIPTIKQ